jgi:acetyl/propionyl-CoA carboxylase alpha subunit
MRVFIANRGEIAVRVARAVRAQGGTSIAAFTVADEGALHTLVADRAVAVAGYLDGADLVRAAVETGATAVHPGYGFLSENAGFARAVLDAGLVWVGPPPAAIAGMGDKLEARRAMIAAGVPVVPGVASADEAEIAAMGFPVMLKAAGGGGGRGMRVVTGPQELADALASARSEAAAAFGNGAVYAERRLVRARHVEVQILADEHEVVALGERECSIQRRHQKLVEEAPCARLSERTRQGVHEAAVRAGRAVGYRGAGTVEFLVDDAENAWFLEMNTRIQVEHPVTEMVWGVDLVSEQLRIAAGERLRGGSPRGHAIECRIVAEDPARGFLPAPGRLLRWREPTGPGVRVDSGVVEGWTVPAEYDALLAKVVCWGADRGEAIRRGVDALTALQVAGVPTTAEYLRDVLLHPAFAAGRTHTGFLDEHFAGWAPSGELDAALLAARALSSARPTSAGSVPTPWQTLGTWP